MIKIDDHVHVSLEGNKIGDLSAISPEEMIISMDKRGVGISVLMTTDFGRGIGSNAEAREIIKKYPDRFMYMCTIDTSLPKEEMVSQLNKEKVKGAIGLGELAVNKRVDSEDIQKLFEVAEKEEMPVLFHMSEKLGGKSYGIYDEPLLPNFEKSLSKFHDLIFVGHSQPFWYEMYNDKAEVTPEQRNSYPKDPVDKEGRLFQLMRDHGNLYCDLSANSAGNALMRDKEFGLRFIREFQDRLIFGTDIYNKDQYFPLADYLESCEREGLLNKEILEKIFSKNFINLYKLKERF